MSSFIPNGPPPPPPPPPSAPVIPKANIRIPPNRESTDPVVAIERRWTFLVQTQPVAIVKHLNLDSIIQDGPKCGLVALAMICSAIGTKHSVEKIFEEAKLQKFTAFGEIFDIRNMKKLCNKFVGRPSTVMDFPSKEALVADLLRGKIFLAPYDADANHEPCKRNGRTAHWAVVFGVLMMRPECYCLEGLERLSKDKPIYRAQLGYDCEMGGTDFLLARQGKSRHVSIWTYEELIESCSQLNEYSEKYDGMILPEGGLQQGLKSKLLRIEL